MEDRLRARTLVRFARFRIVCIRGRREQCGRIMSLERILSDFKYLADAVVSCVRNENLLRTTIGIFDDLGGGKSTLIESYRVSYSENCIGRF